MRLGEVAHVQLAVTNTGRRRWRGYLRDAWAPTAHATVDGVTDRAALDLPAGDTAADRRRRAAEPAWRPPDGPVTLRSLGPLGLAGRQRSVEVDWSVRTLPPFSSRRHLPSRLARLRDMDGRQAIAVRAQGTEFDSLREYVPGDDVRSIDWRATARAADVMVRTWRPERDRRVVMVLDTGRTSAVRIGDETRLDILIDAGLLLAALAGRAGDRVDLVAHDRRTRLQVSGGSGPSLLPRLVDGIATLEPELTETDYRGLVSAVLSRVRKRALVVLFVTLDRPAMEEGLIPALPALTAPAHGHRRLRPRARPHAGPDLPLRRADGPRRRLAGRRGGLPERRPGACRPRPGARRHRAGSDGGARRRGDAGRHRPQGRRRLPRHEGRRPPEPGPVSSKIAADRRPETWMKPRRRRELDELRGTRGATQPDIGASSVTPPSLVMSPVNPARSPRLP